MANTNAQAVAFTNTRIRPMADQLYSCYLSAKKLMHEWNAQSISTVIPNDATIISDGASAGGSAQITNANATNIVTRCTQLINWFENDVLSGGSVTNATLNTVALVEVNGRSF